MAKDLALIYRLSPLLCSLVAFILVMLTIFAGFSPGILEGYDILLVGNPSLPFKPKGISCLITDHLLRSTSLV
jgi:hypothetical protein